MRFVRFVLPQVFSCRWTRRWLRLARRLVPLLCLAPLGSALVFRGRALVWSAVTLGSSPTGVAGSMWCMFRVLLVSCCYTASLSDVSGTFTVATQQKNFMVAKRTV